MVNTFLVHPDYTINARLLDFRRLNKQITEATQIYNVCRKINALIPKPFSGNICDYYTTARALVRAHRIAWGNHPAVIMWLRYEDSLCEYIKACYLEWTTNRRRKNGTLCQYKNTPPEPRTPNPPKPWWVYGSDLMMCHRVILLNKERNRNEPAWYKKIKLFRDIPPEKMAYYTKRGYIWPARVMALIR